MTRIQLRHDTATNWTTANPILAEGEAGVETDTNKMKIGDGVTSWNSLDYFGGNIDLSNYYNKTETNELLDGKQDGFEAQAPITINNGIGEVYDSTGTEYEGTTINRMAYLFQYPSQNSIPGVDTINKSWELRYDNVFIKEVPQSLTILILVYPGIQADRSINAYISASDNLLHAESTLTGTYTTANATITYNEYYDFRITYDGNSATSVQYKLSSDTGWTTLLTSNEKLTKRNFKVQLSVDGNNSIIGDLRGVTFTNDGVVLFKRTTDKLGLSIGAGLTVDTNGLLTTSFKPQGVTGLNAVTQSQYNTLVQAGTVDSTGLYIITDTRKMYFGTVQISSGIYTTVSEQ